MTGEGSSGGASGSVSLDVDLLDQLVSENTRLGDSLTEFMIGSEAVPLPIHTKVVPIIDALDDNLWAQNERASIQQKRTHLDKALREYATNIGAQIAVDRVIYSC